MSKSNYYEATALSLALRDVPSGFTRTNSNRWVALHTADPTEVGATAEASGSSYARAQVNAATANWSGTGDTAANVSAITFPTLSGALGPITHWSIADASTAGNVLYYGSFATPRTYASGDTPVINAGGITVTEA
jgi:hypothetical protein